MSFAANLNKQRRPTVETEAAAIAKQQKADRERIRRLIITLGDDNKKVVGQIKGLAGALEDDVELHGELIAETLLDCVKHLPLKTGIYAAWVARMADKHATWVYALLPRMLDELRAAVRSGGASTAQLVLRFFVGLGNYGVLGLGAVLGLLQEVLALSDGLRPAKGGDLGVFLTMASVPFLSQAAYQKVKDKVDALVAKASPYVASRDARWKPLLRILKTEDLPDRLEALAAAVAAMTAANWSSQAVLHVPGFEPAVDSRPDVPTLGALGISAEEVRKTKFRLTVPLVCCRLLTKSMEEDGADDQMAEHDRWILEDYMLLTIEMFGRDVEECSKQLLRIPVLHPQFDAIAVEVVFSQMLRLPSPPMLPLFYSRLLEAVAEKQASMKKCIEEAYRVLIRSASDLDEECLDTLAEAFAYHLMHTNYQADWSPFTGDSVAVQAQRFIRRTFERLQRLSFHQNLLHRLPEAVHVYVPPEPLPATGLPSQQKPEFARMLSTARIKEPSEEKVLRYCNRLMRIVPKEETASKREDDGPAAAAPATSSASTALAQPVGDAPPPDGGGGPQGDRRRDPGEAGDGPSPAKRPRTDAGDGATSAPPDSAAAAPSASASPSRGAAGAAEAAPAPAAAAGQPGGGAPPVKQEVKAEPEDDPPGAAAGVAVAAATDAAPAKDAKPPPEDDLGEMPAEAWPLQAVVELFMLAMLQNGAKTPTHMSKMLDGHHQVFAKLRPADEDEAHAFAKAIVSAVFSFWRASGQRLEITVDTMLHRGIISSRAVVEHALSERGPQGCDSMAVWNLVNSVARKSLEHTQSVRADLVIARKLGKGEVLEDRKQQLDAAIHETAELFTLVFTGLVRNHQDFEETDTLLRHIMLQRILTIGRKYHAFIKPLIDAAEARIPGVAHNPDIAAIFQSLSTL